MYTHVCPKYSTSIAWRAIEGPVPIEPGGPGPGWHLEDVKTGTLGKKRDIHYTGIHISVTTPFY